MWGPAHSQQLNVFRSDNRICVGRHLANDALFINIATVLWAANISARKDEAGNPILPNTLEAIPGLAVLASSLSPLQYFEPIMTSFLSSRHPLPFDCVITPRFPEVKAIVAHTRELLQ